MKSGYPTETGGKVRKAEDDDGWMGGLNYDDDIEKRGKCAYVSPQNRCAPWGRVQTQSPQLRESDPTSWILNAVQGICATPSTPAPAAALVPSTAYQPLS